MSIKSTFLNMSFLSLALLPWPVVAMASDVGTPDVEVLKGLYPGKTYSPGACLYLSDLVYTVNSIKKGGGSFTLRLYFCFLIGKGKVPNSWMIAAHCPCLTLA